MKSFFGIPLGGRRFTLTLPVPGPFLTRVLSFFTRPGGDSLSPGLFGLRVFGFCEFSPGSRRRNPTSISCTWMTPCVYIEQARVTFSYKRSPSRRPSFKSGAKRQIAWPWSLSQCVAVHIRLPQAFVRRHREKGMKVRLTRETPFAS